MKYSDKEVDHKEDVEGQVYLLGGVFQPWYAGLHAVTELISSQTRNNYQVFVPWGINEVYDQRRDWEDEDKAN